MRTLLLIVCLVWAGVHSAAHGAFALSRVPRGPEVTHRWQPAALLGAGTPRLGVVEAREPQPGPCPELTPVWPVLPAKAGLLAMTSSSHWLASAVEATTVPRHPRHPRSSRGPPHPGV